MDTTQEKTQEKQDLFAQATGKAVEAMALWADANQKVLEQTLTLAASTAADGLRLYAQLQSSAIEATRTGRDFWLRRLGDLPEWQRDPAAWTQQTALEGIEETRKAFTATRENAKAVTRSAEKNQATVEQAAEKIQETLSSLAADLRGLYTPAGR